MKILFLASSADWHIDLWSRYFTISNKVYLFSDTENYLKDQSYKGVKIFKSTGYLGALLNYIKSSSHLLYQINKFLSIYLYAKEIRKLIVKNDIKIIHAHSLFYGYLASFINSDIPIVFTPMGSDIIIKSQENYIYRKMAQKAFAAADLVTGDSLLIQRKGFLVGAKRKNNIIIQNGVDSKIFYRKRNNLKEKYNIGKNEILIFSPRAISPLYNIDIIIDSLNLLKLNNYNFKCMFSFAFGNEFSKKLRKKVLELNLKDNVIWLGYLDYKEMAKHYNASDIVISIPSSDSSPKSVYEAMFCKKPIIISNLDWSHEILPENNVVVRVEPRQSKQVFEAVKKLIENVDYRDKISNNAFKLAHKYFDYEENMKVMEQHMKNLILAKQ